MLATPELKIAADHALDKFRAKLPFVQSNNYFNVPLVPTPMFDQLIKRVHSFLEGWENISRGHPVPPSRSPRKVPAPHELFQQDSHLARHCKSDSHGARYLRLHINKVSVTNSL